VYVDLNIRLTGRVVIMLTMPDEGFGARLMFLYNTEFLAMPTGPQLLIETTVVWLFVPAELVAASVSV